MFNARGAFQHREPDFLKGAIAGFLGGLIGSWVMSRFQEAVPANVFQRLFREGDGGEGGSSESEGTQQENAEPATVKAAEAVSEGVFDHELTEDEKQQAGPAVHFSFGSSGGIVYGLLAEAEPRVTAGAGLPFGAAFWLIADEGGVPALGLSSPPWEHPPSTHAYAFASHLVYGLSAETVRRLVRRML